MRGRVARYKMVPTNSVSNKKAIAVMKNYGILVFLERIFLMIRPLLVLYPVLITITLLFSLVSKTLEPSNNRKSVV